MWSSPTALQPNSTIALAVLLSLLNVVLLLLSQRSCATCGGRASLSDTLLLSARACAGKTCDADDESVWQARPQWTPQQRSHWRAYQDSVINETAQVRRPAEPERPRCYLERLHHATSRIGLKLSTVRHNRYKQAVHPSHAQPLGALLAHLRLLCAVRCGGTCHGRRLAPSVSSQRARFSPHRSAFRSIQRCRRRLIPQFRPEPSERPGGSNATRSYFEFWLPLWRNGSDVGDRINLPIYW